MCWASVGGGSRRLLQPLAGIVLGFVIVWIGMWMSVGYSPVMRLGAAIQKHRAIKGVRPGLTELLQYGVLNNAEFALWIGFPMLILLWVEIVWRTARAVKGDAAIRDTLGGSLLLTLAALNVVGQTKGEVGRLWLFLVPLVCVVASGAATRLFLDRSRSVAFIMAIELATGALMFVSMRY
jgi:hypothetical protein